MHFVQKETRFHVVHGFQGSRKKVISLVDSPLRPLATTPPLLSLVIKRTATNLEEEKKKKETKVLTNSFSLRGQPLTPSHPLLLDCPLKKEVNAQFHK